MASAVSDPRARASLLQMAQVWFRLAERALPADAEQSAAGRATIGGASMAHSPMRMRRSP